ncbi:MAG TPA: glycosyltransferase [Dehalococcoidia bacterium]|nr:glycosyltransferase [Dehalococcoidia bacterium]
MEPGPPERRLRIAVLGNWASPHTHAWVRWFIDRGHEVHAISYYRPREAPEGARVHALEDRLDAPPSGAGGGGRSLLPAWFLRLAHAFRYRMAGLPRVVREIAPDVFHAHYLTEHAFYAAYALDVHPFVATAWGSDVFLDAARSRASRGLVRTVAQKADLVTANNRHMARELVRMGVPESKVAVIVLGAERFFLEGRETSVNLSGGPAPPTVLSTRALEPLYRIDVILRAMRLVRGQVADARLVIAGAGSQRGALETLARELGLEDAVTFAGFLSRERLRDAFRSAHVYVSVPESDGTSVAVTQAMAAGCFPIVSDLPSQEEIVDDGVNGFRAPVGDADALAERIVRALSDSEIRRRAAEVNGRLVEERWLLETNMARMEELYLALASGRGAS